MIVECKEDQGASSKVKKLEFVKYMFMDDIKETPEGPFILQLPFMEHRCNAVIIERYSDGKMLNRSFPRGTSLQAGIFVDKFTDLYADAIVPEISVEDNLKALIEKDKREKKGHAWYFQMCLERLIDPEFVDPRPEFHRLYNEYQKSDDHEAALIKIDEAVARFQMPDLKICTTK